MDIHSKIRMMREMNQWSQEEMAEKMAMSPTGYAKIEKGKTKLNLEKLQQIANIFNIDVVELIAMGEKSVQFVFSGDVSGDNSNQHNFVGNDQALSLENEKLQLVIQCNERLIKQQESEIQSLKKLVDLLQKQLETNIS